MTAGRVATHTHDDIRHGTRALLAARDLHTGQVYDAYRTRQRHPACLAFLRPWARRCPTQTVPMIRDHHTIHRHRKVQAWWQAHPRFPCPFTPTYASWRNQVEHGFRARQRHVRARGSFARQDDLRTTLGPYVRGRNRHAVPPRWQATADAILGPLATLPNTSETVH